MAASNMREASPGRFALPRPLPPRKGESPSLCPAKAKHHFWTDVQKLGPLAARSPQCQPTTDSNDIDLEPIEHPLYTCHTVITDRQVGNAGRRCRLPAGARRH